MDNPMLNWSAGLMSPCTRLHAESPKISSDWAISNWMVKHHTVSILHHSRIVKYHTNVAMIDILIKRPKISTFPPLTPMWPDLSLKKTLPRDRIRHYSTFPQDRSRRYVLKDIRVLMFRLTYFDLVLFLMVCTITKWFINKINILFYTCCDFL